MKDNDKEFIRMLEKAEEIPLKMLKYWHRDNDIRIEMVANALVDGDIDYRIGDLRESGTYDNNLLNLMIKPGESGPLTGYQRVDKIKDYISDSGYCWPLNFMVEATSLKKWINKTFQPGPDIPEVFMSERLRIAVEISKKLYPNGYKVTRGRTSYSVEKDRIEKELGKANIKNKGDLKEWMQKIINPEPWN